MSLANIFASFLKVSDQQAQSIVKLLTVEGRWNEESFNPANIKTQADLIQFIQTLGQSKWFKGHDRSKFAADASSQSIKDIYYGLFQQLGIFETASINENPDYAVILGSGETQVKKRTQTLINDLRRGIIPNTRVIFGLGSNRALANGVLETEAYSKAKLTSQGKPLTEMEMVSLIITEALEHLKTEDEKFSSLVYQPLNTLGSPDRANQLCVKTEDTAKSLRGYLDEHPLNKEHQKTTVAAYSAQPFVERQRRDVQQKLGEHYHAIGAGDEATQAYFNQVPISINICLGELARLINIEFNSQNLAIYQQPLTGAELNELHRLKTQPILSSLPAMLIWVTHKEEFNQWCEEAETSATRAYLSCLKEYKALLTCNNTAYNVKNENSETLNLLQQVKALQKNSTLPENAAILNLQALIERNITKNTAAAKNTLEEALQFEDQLSPQSVIGLLINLSQTYNELGNHMLAFATIKKAETYISKMNLNHAINKHIASAAYSALGYCCRKIGNPQCLNAYTQARDLWPEAVVANNMGIALSKIIDQASLEKAEEIFSAGFEFAKSNNLFVNPYYRADVNIKLAGMLKETPETSRKYINTAQECLAVAESALFNNKSYSANYANKANARVAKLKGDLAFVLGQNETAHNSYLEAVTLRKTVEEANDKKEKFSRKIPNTTQFFHHALLFRDRQAEERTTSLEKGMH